jgi:hypothetical protein
MSRTIGETDRRRYLRDTQIAFRLTKQLKDVQRSFERLHTTRRR